MAYRKQKPGKSKTTNASQQVDALDACDAVATPLEKTPRCNGSGSLLTSRHTLVAVGTLLAAGFAAYSNSFAGAFVFDDIRCIVANQGIRQFWPIEKTLFPPSDPATVGLSGRPLVNLSLAFNYAVGGTSPWGYHALNFAIHLAATLTLFDLVRRTLLLPRLSRELGAFAAPLAFAIALVWMLHPVQTAAVTYVIQRAEALMGLCYLLTLYGVLRGATSQHSFRWYSLTGVACLLGMATKEVMVTAPVVALLYDRTFLAGSFKEAWRRRAGLYAAMAVTWGIIVWGLLATDFHHGTAGAAVEEFTWQSYLLTQPGVILHYLRLAVCPTGLCLDYGWPAATTFAKIVVPAGVVLGLLALTVLALAKYPPWGFLGASFFLILAPTSSFVPIRDATFDHRLYLPLAAIAAGLVVAGFTALKASSPTEARRPNGRNWLQLGLLAVVGVVLGSLTFARNADYASEFSIWKDTAQKAPENPRAHFNLGEQLHRQGQLADAIAQYQLALDIDPKYAAAHNNLGVVFFGRSKIDEALNHYQQAATLKPDWAEVHNNLANALASTGRRAAALAEYEKALALKPDFAEAQNNLGYVLVAEGRIDDAVSHYRAAIELKPDYAQAHSNLAEALARKGLYPDAIRHLREVVRLQPGNLPAANRLAWLLATCPDPAVRNGTEAVSLATRTIKRANPPNAHLYETLAAAYAEVKQFDQAVLCQQKALALVPEADSLELRSRLKLYQAGNPYREDRKPE